MKTKAKRKTIRYQRVLKLPPLPPDQYAALRQNIAVHGVMVPILVDSDGPKRKIIDGWHRKHIADELGYDCPEIVQSGLDEGEKRILARALNLARRQLNTEQKRALIADQLAETPDRSNRWLGKMLGVSHPTVASVRRELDATGKLFQLAKTVGEDGKARPSTYVYQAGTTAITRPSSIPTPAGLCRFLRDLIAPAYKVRAILDPCSGNHALTRPWKGCRVISYELEEGTDFFKCPDRLDVDLVVCNPPFSGCGRTDTSPILLFLKRIVQVVPKGTPVALFVHWGFRLDQDIKSSRWRWLRDHCPPITGIVALPHDVFPGARVHSEVLLFNMPKLAAHYWLPDRYLGK